jgi:uroporphyrin-III C-methyltransferase
MKPIGTVTLVGAGPGDPELLTLKAAKAIASAEVVVYDRLVSEAVLAMVPAGATLIDVGKEPRRHPVPQQEINALLVNHARSGRRVVRLKGGDPYIFGRGSEEALELQSHGIPFAVIPGITSAQGAAVALGVPLTHRGLATGVRYVTGHCRDDTELELDWKGLADPATTLVIYMGQANIDEIATRLLAEGRAPTTPVMAVNNATKPNERKLTTTLANLAADLAGLSFDGPVLFIVGEVVSLHAILMKHEALCHASPSAAVAV